MSTSNELDKFKTLFITLVQHFQMQAWVSLGKLKNPVTDKVEKNVDLGKLSIDILEMLKIKTQGNLTEDEQRLLEQTLVDLRLVYVRERDSANANPGESASRQSP